MVDWETCHPHSEKPTIKTLMRERKEIYTRVPKNIEIPGYQKPCEASKAENGNDSKPEATRKIEPRF